MDSANLDEVARRLNVLIRLELEKQKLKNSEVTTGDRIDFLESAGLAGKNVADILGLDLGQLAAYGRYSRKGKSKGKKGVVTS